MSFPHIKTAAMAFVAALTFHPHSALAEKFTGKVFAKRSQESQDAYIQTSVTMAAMFSTQVDKKISDCINAWYFANDEIAENRNQQFRDTISKYETYHPTGVIVAVLEKQCGPFKN